jgi:large subunit ribosomal protein L24e
MVVKRSCSFCAREIEPGTGMMFVKRDGTVFNFCTSSCRKQQLHLGRVGHRFKWTRAHELKRAADRSSAQKAAPAAPAPPRAGRTRPAHRPAAPPPEVAPPVEAVSAPVAEAAPKETPTPAEPAAPAPAPAPKPRRPRKKAETPAPE